MAESRKLRVRLALLQAELDFYPQVSGSESSRKAEPSNHQIAKSTFPWPKARKEGDGAFCGLRAIPPNPEAGRWFLREVAAPER